MAYTTINKPSDYFNTKLWSGASGDLNITGLDFQPDWVWIKSRNTAGTDHKLVDAVRGNSKSLKSNATEAESTDAEGIQSFNSDGYTLGDNDGNYNRVGRTYVGWNWKANGAGSANNDGNVASTVSVNSTAGFSIVKWSGTTNNKTIGHGLGTVPAMVIAKNTGGSGTNWVVWHKDLTSGYFLKLNLSAAQDNANSYFTADPTNSILSLTGNTAFNSSGNNMIAYCFADVQGYSKFGSYTGNGNADGTFVYTGFKPAFVIFKATHSTTSESWLLLDTVRQPSNVNNRRLRPNTSDAEDTPTANNVDLLSNGFKIRSSDNRLNGNGHTLIYMAFAEAPLVGTNGVTAKAR